MYCAHNTEAAVDVVSGRSSVRVIATFLAACAVSWQASSAAPASIPDLAAGGAAWQNEHNDFILPTSGPGPVTWDPAHHYYGNNEDHPPTARVADLSNPILMPWVREELRKFNTDALAGKVQYTPIARCRPAGV